MKHRREEKIWISRNTISSCWAASFKETYTNRWYYVILAKTRFRIRGSLEWSFRGLVTPPRKLIEVTSSWNNNTELLILKLQTFIAITTFNHVHPLKFDSLISSRRIRFLHNAFYNFQWLVERNIKFKHYSVIAKILKETRIAKYTKWEYIEMEVLMASNVIIDVNHLRDDVLIISSNTILGKTVVFFYYPN